MYTIVALLSLLTVTGAFTLLDKNNVEFSSQAQLDATAHRILAEKTNEIRKSPNKDMRKDNTQGEGETLHVLPNSQYAEVRETEKSHRKKERKGRKIRPLTLLKSPEYCRRTKKCQTIPLSQVLIEKPELAKRLQKWIKIYGKPAEDVIVFQ